MCRTGCPTQDHESWGECARASHFYNAGTSGREMYQKFDKGLEDYAYARKIGLQPETTMPVHVDKCLREAGA